MKGDFYSEHTFYKELRRFTDSEGDEVVEMETNHGQVIPMGIEYVNQILNSANNFKSTKKVSRTELVNQIESNAKVAMTVCFTKLPDLKEKKELLREFTGRSFRYTDKELTSMVKQLQQGETREMIGYYTGSKNESGRLNFFDSEVSILKQVDPRTVTWAIIKNVKYIVK